MTMSPLPCRRRQTSAICSVPDCAVVGSHEGDFGRQLLVGGSAVNVHERYAGAHGESSHRGGRISVDRVDDDGVHLLRNEILDLVQLSADVVLSVFELDRDVQLLRTRLHAGADRCQEVVIEQSHGHAQRGRVRGCGKRRQYAGKQRQTNALHPSKSKREAGRMR